MGSWGVESYANDSCWDALSAKDIHKITQEEADRSIASARLGLTEETWTKQDYLGVVMWVIEHHRTVALEHLEQARVVAQSLVDSKDYLDEWRSPEARRNALLLEIQILEDTIAGKPVVVDRVGSYGVLAKIAGVTQEMLDEDEDEDA